MLATCTASWHLALWCTCQCPAACMHGFAPCTGSPYERSEGDSWVQGLAGLKVGQHAVQSAVKLLECELPGCHMSTLSPVPGFRRWLRRVLGDSEMAAKMLKRESSLQPLLERLLMSKEERASGMSLSSDAGIGAPCATNCTLLDTSATRTAR